MYGPRFTALITEPGALNGWRSTWSEGLADLAGDEIRAGLVACLNASDWPPTLPEFRRLCRPVPDYETAFRDAVTAAGHRLRGENADWSSPALYWTAQDFGFFELQHAAWETSRARWTRLLDERLRDPRLPPIPLPRAALPAVGQTHRRGAARAAIEATTARLTTMRPWDGVAWAHWIMGRLERGEVVSSLLEQKAREVLKTCASSA